MMFLRRPTLLFRFAVCLLAVLQGVAVSWHVCELGGPHGGAAHCHVAAQTAEPAQCHTEDDPTRAWRMVMDEAPLAAGNTHCLAALLSTTPAQTTQAFAFASTFEARVLPRTIPQTPLCDAATHALDARGPPVFS